MLDLRDSENSNWIKNIGQQDEDEEIEKSSPLLTLQEWLNKQAHDNMRPMNPPSRPPHKGAVWNSNTHRWSKSGEADLGKQTAFGDEGGVSSIAEAKRKGLVPQSGDWEAPDRWIKPKGDDEESDSDKEKDDVEESDEDKEKGDSDEDRKKKIKEETQPKGAIAQTLKKFNDKVEKILKTLDDLFGGRVDNPQQTFEDLEKLKTEVDQEIVGAKDKISKNKNKVNDLHDSGKIDDEIEKKAYIELEDLRKYVEREEEELNEKWDKAHEKILEQLSLEEQGGEEESEEEEQPESDDKNIFDVDDEEDFDEEDFDFDEEAAGMPEAQWNAQAKAGAENSWAKDTGWGSDVDSEADDFHEKFTPEGKQKNSLGLAHEVREYAKTNQTEDTPLINELGEPHDDIYDYHDLGDEEPVTLQHIKDYIESKGTSPPDADWEGEEESLEQPTVKGNAKSLLDRTTNEMKKFKDMRKNIEERQKLLESRLEEAGDELKEKILQQITHSKNRINSINTSLKTQIRKIKMAKSILTKKSLVEEETLNNE